ncbi:SpoIIIAH-like family protein [Oceanobacillus senegalensis]|uniref:SpoIIIAH-like family protein n=1 Tax=Oceanobacillus senegalensis TaxID=1936063 RepID=UPI000A310AF5|nr:SpoIIIAH-like family protein [Oceanobacillus senegalensis]
MLKKQTVWLLTMLSLMIVLSVYYMISPDNDDLAYIDNGQSDAEGPVATKANGSAEGLETEVDEISNMSGDELFTTIRMEVQDDRSVSKERLEAVVASSSASAKEKDQAMKEIDQLEDAAKKERILEESILSAGEYQDVLVRSEDSKVHVHVKAEELSDTEANNIMRMVHDEFGEITVDVIVQPSDNAGDSEDTEDTGSTESE